MKYGLWDTKAKCWLGNGKKEKGPNLYDDAQLAGAAATVATRMLKFPIGRILPKPFNDTDLKYAGKYESVHSADEVLTELLKGES